MLVAYDESSVDLGPLGAEFAFDLAQMRTTLSRLGEVLVLARHGLPFEVRELQESRGGISPLLLAEGLRSSGDDDHDDDEAPPLSPLLRRRPPPDFSAGYAVRIFGFKTLFGVRHTVSVWLDRRNLSELLARLPEGLLRSFPDAEGLSARADLSIFLRALFAYCHFGSGCDCFPRHTPASFDMAGGHEYDPVRPAALLEELRWLLRSVAGGGCCFRDFLAREMPAVSMAEKLRLAGHHGVEEHLFTYALSRRLSVEGRALVRRELEERLSRRALEEGRPPPSEQALRVDVELVRKGDLRRDLECLRGGELGTARRLKGWRRRLRRWRRQGK